MKIAVIFGTRPEAIKLAPVIKELKKDKNNQISVCSTGQHREMLKQVLDIFSLKIDYDLDLMKKNQDLFDITTNALKKLKSTFNDLQPDLIIVQGDTTTAFVASLAAYYCKIKVAHVEAGLRSYNIYSPYPEEANRRFISSLAELNFAPTVDSSKNLLREGFRKDQIFITGNTVVDALNEVKKVVRKKEVINKYSTEFRNKYRFNPLDKKFVLITLHRREKFGKEMESLFYTIKNLSNQYPDYNFVYPVHLNPNVKKPVEKILSNSKNIYLLPPQDYLKFIFLMSKCHIILSDSGGVQEECYVFSKPILVMRDVTERNEAIKAGYAFLMGTDQTKIERKFAEVNKKLLNRYNFFKSENPFGDGKASKRIRKIINSQLMVKS
jgi:UDP-N-acetylglucosamine 2-epimerase (non-hydrolysing)